MRVSKKFPLAVHSLLFVAVLSPKKRVTSTLVAESTETNPVTVRNIFLTLEEHGFLIATAGKNGGVCLAKEPKDITLWDVYLAMETNDVEEIFKLHEMDSDCPVGKNIFSAFVSAYARCCDGHERQYGAGNVRDFGG
ncbi:MAG: Rrf2 family transcriptional regulator [Phascolarctobacterium sp.]|nr:Rrf2 family transcriptional regulator [Phascolarctobacterium sp.]